MIIDGHIVDIFPNSQKHITWECPRCCCPGEEVEFPFNKSFFLWIENFFEKIKIDEIVQKFPFVIDDCSVDIDCKTKAVFIQFFSHPLDIFVFFRFLERWKIIRLYLKSVNSSRLWEMNDFYGSEILARSELCSDFFFEFSFECCREIFSFFNFPSREKPEVFLGMMNHRIATFLITKYSSYNINKPILRTRILLAFRCKVWKFYSKCSILPILISFCNFVVCKWCCTTWTVSLYFESFVYFILIVYIRKASHYAFHKI